MRCASRDVDCIAWELYIIPYSDIVEIRVLRQVFIIKDVKRDSHGRRGRAIFPLVINSVPKICGQMGRPLWLHYDSKLLLTSEQSEPEWEEGVVHMDAGPSRRWACRYAIGYID